MKTHPVEVDHFAEHARGFVAWCQTAHDSKDQEAFKLEALQTLSAVYNSALHLPGVDFRPSPEPPSATPEQRQAVAKNLAALPFQYYWEVFTPSEVDGDKEPVCGDLFDDFQDIYSDLSSGLWLYDRGHVEAAVFSWQQMFGIHWGRHVVSAMHALHSFEPKEESNAF